VLAIVTHRAYPARLAGANYYVAIENLDMAALLKPDGLPKTRDA